MNHNHDECQHELKHCEHCDVVYCVKCKKEWGEKETVYVPCYVQPYVNTPWYPYTTITGVSSYGSSG